ncbi:MAG: hypothetical protein AB1Z98_28000 [Nannocystaceae bacterium]
MPRRRTQATLLEIPSDHEPGWSHSTPTLRGHAPTVEPTAPSPEPNRAAPWTETLYVSPSGRIFLPPGFDFGAEGPHRLTPHAVRRDPPPPKRRRAHVVIGLVPSPAPRPRVPTRESWVVPPHLRPD